MKFVVYRDPFVQNMLKQDFAGTDQEIENRLGELSKKVYEITKI